LRCLFFRYGFSKVTMDEAAHGMGMSKKTLYQHFSSKDSLLEEVTHDHIQECESQFKAICGEPGGDVMQKLKRYMIYLSGIYGQMSEALVHDLRRSAPEIWKQVEKHRKQSIECDFGGLIKEGRQKGLFRKDVDERLFLLIHLAVMQNILNPEVLVGLPFKPSQVFEAIIKVLFEGLLTDKGRAEYHAKS
jgi:AcrR family transcriptional regulator